MQNEYKKTRQDTKEQAFYSSARWRKLRAWKLRANPLCENCEANGWGPTPAAVVHHTVPIKDGGDWMAIDGLVSLCKACHNRLHGGKGE
ncbi:MAG: HNH endonuclease [Syntrophomonadaceae bacterium]|nr:HNH endonuclease [Syntrophomonadaceae bacterium]